jgi:hypothetical protein
MNWLTRHAACPMRKQRRCQRGGSGITALFCAVGWRPPWRKVAVASGASVVVRRCESHPHWPPLRSLRGAALITHRFRNLASRGKEKSKQKVRRGRRPVGSAGNAQRCPRCCGQAGACSKVRHAPRTITPKQGGAAGLSKVAGGRLGAAATELAERCMVALHDTASIGKAAVPKLSLDTGSTGTVHRAPVNHCAKACFATRCRKVRLSHLALRTSRRSKRCRHARRRAS